MSLIVCGHQGCVLTLPEEDTCVVHYCPKCCQELHHAWGGHVPAGLVKRRVVYYVKPDSRLPVHYNGPAASSTTPEPPKEPKVTGLKEIQDVEWPSTLRMYGHHEVHMFLGPAWE